MELTDSSGRAELKDLWCLSPSDREARDQAVTGLRLDSFTPGQHRFVRPEARASAQESWWSSPQTLALSMGHIISLTAGSVEVILDRDLTQLASEDALFHLGRYIY